MISSVSSIIGRLVRGCWFKWRPKFVRIWLIIKVLKIGLELIRPRLVSAGFIKGSECQLRPVREGLTRLVTFGLIEVRRFPRRLRIISAGLIRGLSRFGLGRSGNLLIVRLGFGFGSRWNKSCLVFF